MAPSQKYTVSDNNTNAWQNNTSVQNKSQIFWRFTCITERIIQIQRIQKTFSSPYLYLSSDGYVVKLLRCRHSGFCLRVPGSVLKPSTFFTSGYVYISVHIIICIVITQFGSACECNSLALKLTKENTKNVKFEDPSLMFSIVWDARDQTGPGSLSLRRETLGTRLAWCHFGDLIISRNTCNTTSSTGYNCKGAPVYRPQGTEPY